MATATLTPKQAAEEIIQLGLKNPVGWIEEVLQCRLYSRAQDIVEAIAENDRIAIRSGHGVSKTYTLAAVAIWWAIVMRGLCIVTGPKYDQMVDTFFGSLRKILGNAILPPSVERKLEPTMDRWIINPVYGVGIIAVNSDRAVNVQGYHGERVLLIADEAAGVPDAFIDAFEATQVSEGVSGASAKIVLAGNPTEEKGCVRFKQANSEGSEYMRMHIPSSDSPNVTGEMLVPGLTGPQWIERQRAKSGEESAWYYIRVLGEYWKEGAFDRVIPEATLTEAAGWEPELAQTGRKGDPKEPRHSCAQGFDVGRFGDDPSVSAIVRDGVLVDIMARAGMNEVQCAAWAAERAKAFNVPVTYVDETGLGAGVVDILKQQHQECETRGINFAGSATNKRRYKNIRAEMAFQVRDALVAGELGLPEETPAEVWEDLREVRYQVLTNGLLQLEDKEKAKARLGRSPDYGDASMLAWRGYRHRRDTTSHEKVRKQLRKAVRRYA